MKKKGNAYLFVMFLFVVVIFLFALVNIVVYKVQDDLDDYVLADLELNESKEIVQDTTSRFPSVFDGAILIVFVGIWVAGIAAGWSKDEHPMLFGFMLLVCIAVLVAGMFVANTFDDFMDDSDFSGYASSFPKSVWLMSHLVEVGVMLLLSVLMAAMAKNKVG